MILTRWVSIIPLLISGCPSPTTSRDCSACTTESVAIAMAGPDAQDCGRSYIGADASAVHACSSDALLGKRPFFALFEVSTVDSAPVRGTVGKEQGGVSIVMSDSRPD